MSEPQRSSLTVPEEELTTHLVVDRRSRISPWGKGNSKLGPGVYTFDRLPGKQGGTCPGSTPECENICYAKRLAYNRPVWKLLRENSDNWIAGTRATQTLPADARLVRIHVSGDFDSVYYIDEWIVLVRGRRDVAFWGYTRSWRVPELADTLETLRNEPNVQLFASVDKSSELPPQGWRIAWIDGDIRLIDGRGGKWATRNDEPTTATYRVPVCPEETGRKKNCVECRYCFDGKRGDIVFLEH